MNLNKSVRNLTKFEKGLWFFSMITVIAAFTLGNDQDWLTLFASLIGVTSLIFVAKGDVLGQILIIVFSIYYAVISYQFRYFGEMVTFLGMTAPIAMLSVVTWLKNPYSEKEVKVSSINKDRWVILLAVTVVVTVASYYILRYWDTTNLVFSTLSVSTSFLASSLMMLRSPYYALSYAANDLILIVLWTLASIKDISYMPMIVCFSVFFINDLYGYWNWNIMKRRQNKEVLSTVQK